MCPNCVEYLCLECYGPDYEPGAWCQMCIIPEPFTEDEVKDSLMINNREEKDH